MKFLKTMNKGWVNLDHVTRINPNEGMYRVFYREGPEGDFATCNREQLIEAGLEKLS